MTENDLKKKVVELALSEGAVKASVTNCEYLAGLPYADPRYVLPDTRSAISFAASLGTDWTPCLRLIQLPNRISNFWTDTNYV